MQGHSTIELAFWVVTIASIVLLGLKHIHTFLVKLEEGRGCLTRLSKQYNILKKWLKQHHDAISKLQRDVQELRRRIQP
jgi:hypothetical protein